MRGMVLALVVALLLQACATAPSRSSEDGPTIGQVLGAVLLGVGAFAIARKHGGGGAAGLTQPVDFDWDWDQFQDQNGRLVWACRGAQTGQFAELSRCAMKVRSDLRWPGIFLR